MDFKEARERFETAIRMMKTKEMMKNDLPPKGSAFYRYYIESDKNPEPYEKLCEKIDKMTLEQCKASPYWFSGEIVW